MVNIAIGVAGNYYDFPGSDPPRTNTGLHTGTAGSSSQSSKPGSGRPAYQGRFKPPVGKRHQAGIRVGVS